MKTAMLTGSLVLILAGLVYGQQHRTSLNEGYEYTMKLLDITADIEVVAHARQEIIIDASGLPGVPDKAKGLRPLMTNSGVDNTGIGLNMKIIDEVIALSGGRTSASLKYKISIPRNVNLFPWL